MKGCFYEVRNCFQQRSRWVEGVRPPAVLFRHGFGGAPDEVRNCFQQRSRWAKGVRRRAALCRQGVAACLPP